MKGKPCPFFVNVLLIMPLWSDLFKGHDKGEPFKPKRSHPVPKQSHPANTYPDSQERCRQGSSGGGPSSQTTTPLRHSPRQTPASVQRSNSHDSTAPSRVGVHRSNSAPSPGLKRSPSYQTSSHDDTITTITQTMQANRQKKSSTPKTPQTPQPPAIHMDRINKEESEPIIMEPLDDNEDLSWDNAILCPPVLSSQESLGLKLDESIKKIQDSIGLDETEKDFRSNILGLSQSPGSFPEHVIESVNNDVHGSHVSGVLSGDVHDLSKHGAMVKQDTAEHEDKPNEWTLAKVPNFILNYRNHL